MNARPIIILGAARSGTNILRDTLCRLPGVGTWPCDEINYIWRHGNARYPTDEFTADMARPRVVDYIRTRFQWEADRQELERIVEKTCANTVRVEFVDQVVPEATYVVIVRDGLDVALSARERWTSSLPLRYSLRKIRYVPFSDVPYYAVRQLWNRLEQFLDREKRLRFWGPRFEGMDAALRERPLEEVCALQWARSVERTEDALSKISPERVVRVRYEDLALEPRQELARVLDALAIDSHPGVVEEMSTMISPNSVGRGRREFSATQRRRLTKIIEPAMERLSDARS